jgi:hypothetical protein
MRAGSITVAELIKNRPTPVRLPARDERDEAVTEPLVTNGLLDEPVQPAPVAQPNTHRRPPAHTKQLAKLAGLGVATAVLCASIAAASIITTNRQATVDEATRPVVEMSDQQALLPNLFTLGPAQDRQATTGLPTPNKGSAAATLQNPSPKALADTKRATGGPAQTFPVDAELVRHYYTLLSSTPNQALGLMDGLLQQSDLSHFLDSWARIHTIRVLDVQERPDGALLAVVEMVLPDGGTARVQQLLRVTDTVPQRIAGAEIISAQRS